MRIATSNIQRLRTKQTEVFKELKYNKIDICVLMDTKKKGNEKVGEYTHIFRGVYKIKWSKIGVSLGNTHGKYKENWETIDEEITFMKIE